MLQLPDGYEIENNGGPFTEFAGPLFRKRDAAPGTVAKAFRVQPHHVNGAGAAHGGMLCTFIANLLGTAAETLSPGGLLVTATLATSFISAAAAGDLVEGEARMIRGGRRLVFLRAEARVGPRVVLSAEATFARVAT